MKSKLILTFVQERETDLFQAEFYSPFTGLRYRTVRGKTEGAFRGAGTFQWTSAVKGFAVLAVRTAAHAIDHNRPPLIEGGTGSIASSLDYAVSKGPGWLLEMFGTDSAGEIAAKRLFRRSNPNRKRPGPVVISLAPDVLRPENISIELDSVKVTQIESLESIASRILAQCSRLPAEAPEGLKLVVNK